MSRVLSSKLVGLLSAMLGLMWIGVIGKAWDCLWRCGSSLGLNGTQLHAQAFGRRAFNALRLPFMALLFVRKCLPRVQDHGKLSSYHAVPPVQCFEHLWCVCPGCTVTASPCYLVLVVTPEVITARPSILDLLECREIVEISSTWTKP